MDAVRTLIALLAGYAAGSVSVAPAIGRLAGVDAAITDAPRFDSTAVAAHAGPGWGLLALVADLAQGVMPVTLAAVTFSWGAGWAAGLGAIAGTSWPALGRRPGGSGVVVLAGVAIALEPVAAMAAVIVGVVAGSVAFGLARFVRREARGTALAVGLGVYPLLFAAAEPDVVRVLGVVALYVAALVGPAVNGRR